MELLYTWLGLTAFFLILELLTATFYGLSLSFAAWVTAIYVLISHETDFSLVQGVVFVVSSGIFAYILPKILVSKAPDLPQGLAEYTGMTRAVKKVGNELKIVLDGVDYPIETDDDIKPSDKVKITGHKGIALIVKKL
jgi:membrane protein implicated in regulation of membrane protease activity